MRKATGKNQPKKKADRTLDDTAIDAKRAKAYHEMENSVSEIVRMAVRFTGGRPFPFGGRASGLAHALAPIGRHMRADEPNPHQRASWSHAGAIERPACWSRFG
jgi:hypothetical protein